MFHGHEAPVESHSQALAFAKGILSGRKQIKLFELLLKEYECTLPRGNKTPILVLVPEQGPLLHCMQGYYCPMNELNSLKTETYPAQQSHTIGRLPKRIK